MDPAVRRRGDLSARPQFRSPRADSLDLHSRRRRVAADARRSPAAVRPGRRASSGTGARGHSIRPRASRASIQKRTMNKLRVGIISANWGVAAHLPAWRANEDVEVVGICTAHRETAEGAARANNIPMPFWDFREMARHPDIDIVDAGTRPNLRYEMCLAALRAGKHVYDGIPFADSMAHAREMYEAYKASGTVAAVDAYSEHMPPIAFEKELIDDGAVGELYSLTCTLQMSLFNHQVSTFPYNWFWQRSAGCSALRNLGSHAINVLYYLFGEIDEVVAQDEIFLKEWKFVDNGSTLTPEIEDTANVLLRFTSGGIGVLAPAWCAIAGRGFMI